MKLFLEYMYQHRKTIFFYFLFSFIFMLTFWLYNVPIITLGYSFLLCLFIGSIAATVDFIRFKQHHQALEELKHRVMMNIDELPMPTNQIEEDYQELIKVIHESKVQLITEKDQKYDEMMDYYTLWAHQIKTPISALRLLLDEVHSNECEEELFKIEGYVEMVLSYLNIDHQGSDLQIELVDVDHCIKQCIRKYAKLFIRKKLQLHYEGTDYQALTDEKWLCFIIGQLLSNAIKYTPKGSITITVEDEKLRIRDTGIGIQKEDIPRVFEKGFTGYNGHQDKKSTGIGLYLVKKVCRKLGHPIHIYSELNEYTMVEIDLHHYNLIVE